jgi:hypothetical protein
LNGTIASLTCCYCYKWNPKLKVDDKEYSCKNEDCKKVYPRDPGAAKNNTAEGAQYKKELAEAERAAAEEAERARKRAAEAQRGRRSLRQRVR